MKLSVGSHEVVLKDYLTGGQFMELKRLEIGASKLNDFDREAGEYRSIDTDPSVAIDLQMKALEFLVVSLDGSEEKAFAKVKDLPSEEFQDILVASEEIRNKKKGMTSETSSKG